MKQLFVFRNESLVEWKVLSRKPITQNEVKGDISQSWTISKISHLRVLKKKSF